MKQSVKEFPHCASSLRLVSPRSCTVVFWLQGVRILLTSQCIVGLVICEGVGSRARVRLFTANLQSRGLVYNNTPFREFLFPSFWLEHTLNLFYYCHLALCNSAQKLGVLGWIRILQGAVISFVFLISYIYFLTFRVCYLFFPVP